MIEGMKPDVVSMLWVAHALRGNGKAAKQLARAWHAIDPRAPTTTFLEVAQEGSDRRFNSYYGVKVYRKVRLPDPAWRRTRKGKRQ